MCCVSYLSELSDSSRQQSKIPAVLLAERLPFRIAHVSRQQLSLVITVTVTGTGTVTGCITTGGQAALCCDSVHLHGRSTWRRPMPARAPLRGAPSPPETRGPPFAAARNRLEPTAKNCLNFPRPHAPEDAPGGPSTPHPATPPNFDGERSCSDAIIHF